MLREKLFSSGLEILDHSLSGHLKGSSQFPFLGDSLVPCVIDSLKFTL
jgi:hypothetical protein